MLSTYDFLKEIFPQILHEHAYNISIILSENNILPKFDIDSNHNIRTIKYGAEILKIPSRIYFSVSEEKLIKPESTIERSMLLCLYSRYHDGYVREYCAKELLKLNENWIPSFILLLAGEYVLGIVKMINEYKDTILKKNTYKNFILDNPDFIKLIEQRIISYWNCYYNRLCKLEDYPGIQFINACKRI